MTEAAASSGAVESRPRLSAGLLVTIVLDLIWSVSALVLSGFSVLALLIFPTGERMGVSPGPVETLAPEWSRNFVLVEGLVSLPLNLLLLWGAISLLLRRRSALLPLRIWAIGMLVVSFADLVMLGLLANTTYGYLAVPFVCCVLPTPLWAVFHLVAFARPGFRGQLA